MGTIFQLNMKDSANLKYKHTLFEDMVIDLPGFFPVYEFRNKWLHIEDERVTISSGYSCDGATGVPDFKTVKRAWTLHDAFYQFAEDIAKEFGISVKAVLKIADGLFRDIMVMDGTHPTIVWTYYNGVCILGYGYHKAARWVRKLIGKEFESGYGNEEAASDRDTGD